MSLLTVMRSASERLQSLPGWRGPEIERFALHLADLELLGRQFTLNQYRTALEYKKGKTIILKDYLDDSDGLLESWQLSEGYFAGYKGGEDEVFQIYIRESLKSRPWPSYEHVAYHELMHIALDHRLPSQLTPPEHDKQERQANQWADWMLLASMEPDRFSRERTETLT